MLTWLAANWELVVIGSMTPASYLLYRVLPEDWFEVKQAWCQGCDLVQPVASMRFTEIGLYRCDICRTPPKVVKQGVLEKVADKLAHDVVNDPGVLQMIQDEARKLADRLEEQTDVLQRRVDELQH